MSDTEAALRLLIATHPDLARVYREVGPDSFWVRVKMILAEAERADQAGQAERKAEGG